MKPSVLGSLFGFKDYLFLEEKQSFLLQIEEEEKLHRYSGKMKAFIIKKKKKAYTAMLLCFFAIPQHLLATSAKLTYYNYPCCSAI